MEERKRHELIWKIARPLAMAGDKLIFGYRADIYGGKGPYLVLSNHNAELDPLMTAYSFPDPLYFVASEHIMRKGPVSDFLRWSTSIITRQKGGSAAATVRNIVRELQEGHSVCLYPEGNRSWDGITRPITPSTGKLVRMSGAKLITYRTEGAYFASPRWAGGSIRRGRVRGRIVGVYEPEYLKGISAKQVQEIIDRDLHEDAYNRQLRERRKFFGTRRAEHLETLLFLCPYCSSEGRLKSEGNSFFCTECGKSLTYGTDGFFRGDDLIFDNVRDWSLWQTEQINAKCLTAEDRPIFSDTGMMLFSVQSAEGERLCAGGRLTLFRDRLVLPDKKEVPISKLGGMAIMGAQDLYLSFAGKNFVIRSGELRCTSKYLTACKVFDKSLQYGV